MIKISLSKNIEDNATTKFITKFNLAFAECDTDYILSCFAEDAHWEMAGGPSWRGRDAIRKTLATMNDGDASEVILDNIIVSGNQCAASGTLKYEHGRNVTYCDVYTFAPGTETIQTLKAYAIETE